MGDLDNYRDCSHYSSEISHEIAARICDAEGKLDSSMRKDEIRSFFKYIKNYDYSEWEQW